MIRTTPWLVSLVLLASCASQPDAPLNTTPVPASPAVAALQDGLAVRYYGGSFSHVRELEDWMAYKDGASGPPITRLSYRSGKGPVLTSGDDNLVGAHITGFLRFETAGTYRLRVTNNDGVRVHVGGARVYDDPKTGPDRTSAPIPVEITRAGWYPVEIWYFEKSGTSTLDVEWAAPGGGFQAIPPTVLKH